MKKQDIVEKVRVIMNEAGAEESLQLLSEDTVKLNVYIESVIADAINLLMVEDALNPRFFNLSNNIQGVISTVYDGASRVVLPADFLRFVSIRFSGWKRAVSTLHAFGSDQYKKQKNTYTRAGVNKPVSVVAFYQGNEVIENYPSGTLEDFTYVKKINDTTDSSLANINEGIFISICYMCASLVYSIFEMSQQSELMKKISIEQLPKN